VKRATWAGVTPGAADADHLAGPGSVSFRAADGDTQVGRSHDQVVERERDQLGPAQSPRKKSRSDVENR
jgi:hypothetical protein